MDIRRDAQSESFEELANGIHGAAIALLRRLRREDDQIGLSAPLLSALSVVVFRGPLTIGELARAEQVTPPSMTRTVRSLERRRLVILVRSDLDARVTVVHGTPKGRRVLDRGRKRRVAALVESLSRLSARDRATLRRAVVILGRLATQLAR